MNKQDILKLLPAIVPVLGSIFVPMLNTDDPFLKYLPAGLIILTVIYIVILIIKNNINTTKKTNERLSEDEKKKIEFYDDTVRQITGDTVDVKKFKKFIENLYDLNKYLVGTNLNTKEVIKILDKLSERKHLSEHDIFTTEKRRLNYRIDLFEKEIHHKGKKWVVVNFLKIKLHTTLEKLIDFIDQHHDIIYSETKQLDISKMIEAIYDSLKEVNKKAIKIGIPELFISKFEEFHSDTFLDLMRNLKRVETSQFFYNDYTRIFIVLESVLQSLSSSFHGSNLIKILQLNSELDKEYDKIAKMLDEGVLQ
ncbi:MAG: hypothetical protein ACOCWW_01800 [Bacteroidota bacterium]